MQSVIETLNFIFGIAADDLSVFQVLARSVVVFIVGIGLVRIGKKRFIGKIAAFDVILAVLIGSLLSRAITEANLFLEILAACFLLIALHRLFSLIAAHSDKFGNLIKGHERIIVQDGEILWKSLQKSNLSKQDLMQTLRLNAQIADVAKIKIARLERNGDISVIMKNEE